MTFLPKADLLSLEELDRLCSAFIAKGVTQAAPDRRRAAGAARHHDAGVVAVAPSRAAARSRNSRSPPMARSWKNMPPSSRRHGVERINVSLDTLDPDKFRAITRWGDLDKVLAGIDAAQAAGLEGQDQRGGAQGRQRGRDRRADRMGAWPRHGSHGDRGDAARRHRRGPARSVSAAVDGARAARRTLHARGHRLSHRRTGALRARQGNRRPARLHHADDA